MYRQRRTKRRTIEFRSLSFYLMIGGAAVLLAVLLILLLQPAKVMLAEKGDISFSRDFDAVIVRDEQVYETENYEKAVFMASEGQKLKVGDSIAEVYKWGYNDNIMNQLLDLQNKIMDYQENTLLADVINPTLKDYNTKVTAKSQEIQQVISGQKEGDIITLERDLKTLLTSRMDYLKTAVKTDETLKDLYSQKDTVQARINEYQTVIKSNIAGYVSFYFDGCEQFINIQNMDKLTQKNIDSILKGEVTTLVKDEKASRPLYRLVNSNKWYVLLYADSKVSEFINNASFDLTFKDIYNSKFTGTVQSERKDVHGYIYKLVSSDDVSPLLRERKVNVTMKHTYVGIKLPESAIKEKDGVTGVNVHSDSAVTFVPVTVLIRQDGEAVVTPVDKTSALQENVQVEY